MNYVENVMGLVIEIEGKILVGCPLRRDREVIDDEVHVSLLLALIEHV
jgi:hypothetical protein